VIPIAIKHDSAQDVLSNVMGRELLPDTKQVDTRTVLSSTVLWKSFIIARE
jgi:hypothetical protein